MSKLFTGVRAPSTLGSFLRSFRFGHVRQVDAVASRVLAGLAGVVPGLLPGPGQLVLLDVDDTIKPVYGRSKQGAGRGYTHIRGLNAQLVTACGAGSAPVIAAARLRRGAAASAHGAVRLVRDAIATLRRAQVTGPVLVRADSAYYNRDLIAHHPGRGLVLGRGPVEHLGAGRHRHHRSRLVDADRVPERDHRPRHR